MAAPALSEEQRVQLIEWLAAGHPKPLIDMLFQAKGWTPITRQSLDHHRERHREQIERRRKEREERAYNVGLAQWQERVKALVTHAATLADLKWVPDEKGKLHNEKAWRETLDDIAKEMGHRKGLPDAGTMTAQQLIEALTGQRLPAVAAAERDDGPTSLPSEGAEDA